jgi:hypothetical protein
LATGVGHYAGGFNQGQAAVAVGFYAGYTGQGVNSVAVGPNSGQVSQGVNSVAVGSLAGQTSQGSSSVAIGVNSGTSNQSNFSVAIGINSGNSKQGQTAVAIGPNSGQLNQNENGVAIGNSSGYSNQGTGSVAIGYLSGYNNQAPYSIALNASLSPLSPTTSGLFIDPIASTGSYQNNTLFYDTVTKEVKFSTTKTFVIDHPLDPKKLLVHACLEGPESGVYYRGKGEVQGETIVSLPSYVSSLATDLTAYVTPIGAPTMMGVSEVENNQFTVFGNGKFNWLVMGSRSSIEVEVEKSQVEVKGSGPYKWI